MNVDGVIRVTIVLQKARLLLIYCTMKESCLNIIYTFSVAVNNTLFQLHNSTVACIIRMAVSRPRQSKLTPIALDCDLFHTPQKLFIQFLLAMNYTIY